MLEKKQGKAVSLKSAVKSVKRETTQDKSLVDLIRADHELYDFFKLIHDQDLRQHAHELLSQRMKGVMH